MCDAMDPDKLEAPIIAQILSAIIDGMRSDRPNEVGAHGFTCSKSRAFLFHKAEGEKEWSCCWLPHLCVTSCRMCWFQCSRGNAHLIGCWHCWRPNSCFTCTFTSSTSPTLLSSLFLSSQPLSPHHLVHVGAVSRGGCTEQLPLLHLGHLQQRQWARHDNAHRLREHAMYRHGGSGESLRVPRPHKRPVLPPAAALHGHHLPTHYCCHKNGRPQRSVRDNIFIFIHRCHYIPYCITFMNVSTFILPSLIGTLLTPLLSSPLLYSFLLLVGMQAIEFWSTVCDCETSVLDDIREGVENAPVYMKLIEQAAPTLVPIMLETLTKQQVGTLTSFLYIPFHSVCRYSPHIPFP